MSEKWKIVSVNYANLDQPSWNLIVKIRGPSGSNTSFYPAPPENYEQMTLEQMKQYALSEWMKANEGC